MIAFYFRRFIWWYVCLAGFVLAMVLLQNVTGMSDGALDALGVAIVIGSICWGLWRSEIIEAYRSLAGGARRFGRWAGVAALGFVALWFALRVIHWAWSTPFPFGS